MPVVTRTLGSVVFAPDGTMLLVGVGDGSDGDCTLTARSGLEQHQRRRFLRINRDEYRAHRQPICDGTNSMIRSKVWLYGVRNPIPFRPFSLGAVTPGLGRLAWNTLREERVEPRWHQGRQLPGWPCYEGNGASAVLPTIPPSRDLWQPIGRAPVIRFPCFTPTRPQPGQRRQSADLLLRDRLPAAIPGELPFSASDAGELHQAHPASTPATTRPGAQPFATDVAAPVSMEVGPDGLILLSLVHLRGDSPRFRSNAPLAVASAAPSCGALPRRPGQWHSQRRIGTGRWQWHDYHIYGTSE